MFRTYFSRKFHYESQLYGDFVEKLKVCDIKDVLNF